MNAAAAAERDPLTCFDHWSNKFSCLPYVLACLCMNTQQCIGTYVASCNLACTVYACVCALLNLNSEETELALLTVGKMSGRIIQSTTSKKILLMGDTSILLANIWSSRISVELYMV